MSKNGLYGLLLAALCIITVLADNLYCVLAGVG